MAKFINLTPHAIHEVESRRSFPPSGEVARIKVSYQKIGTTDGVPMYKAQYGEVEGLPAPEKDTIYIVSGAVKSVPSVAERCDVVAPGDLVRDSNGQPIGCKGFKIKV